MRLFLVTSVLHALAVTIASAGYVWPSRYDFFEDLLAIQSGYISFGFTSTCGNGQGVIGRQNSAEWIRAAFHDVATHDKTAGTGGLDASIMYELDRDENPGDAFNRTFADMSSFLNPRARAADLLALSVVPAVAGCGGQRIPFRVGRVDAAHAGPQGVPKPDQTLESHREAFSRAGFNTSDMIALVACGHTLGGVHSVENPHIVDGEISQSNVVRFDRMNARFDTAVVDEYLKSDGRNPLVFGHNDTLNSDKRIFASDGNATVRALSEPSAFQATYVDVFERMIDTVPAGVVLSEPLQIIDIKPYITRLGLDTQGAAVDFHGRFRVRVSPETKRDSWGIQVSLNVAYQNGQRTLVKATHVRFQGGISSGFFGESFAWYEFEAKLDPTAGFTGFDIQLETIGSGEVEVFDNGGTGGYPFENGLLFAPDRSCLNISPANGGNFTATVTAAVREELIAAGGTTMTLEFAHRIPQQNIMLPRL